MGGKSSWWDVASARECVSVPNPDCARAWATRDGAYLLEDIVWMVLSVAGTFSSIRKVQQLR